VTLSELLQSTASMLRAAPDARKADTDSALPDLDRPPDTLPVEDTLKYRVVDDHGVVARVVIPVGLREVCRHRPPVDRDANDAVGLGPE
jgi:hypothetical protein